MDDDLSPGGSRQQSLVSLLAGVALIAAGILATLMALDGKPISSATFWTILGAVVAGAATFFGLRMYMHGHRAAGGALSTSSVLAAAGFAGLLRHSDVLLRVGVLMFLTGFLIPLAAIKLARLVNRP
jgi:hypothetical protein